MPGRLQRLRAMFGALNIDAFLVTFLPHLRYLSRFSGSNGIGLVTRRSAVLITDRRYTVQAKQEVSGWSVFISSDGVLDELANRRLLRTGWNVGFDGNTVTLAQFRLMKKLLPGVSVRPKADTIERLGIVKDASEIASIRKAVEITDRVFNDILGIIRPGIRECDVAAEVSYLHRTYGSERDAFEPIVVSGSRGALPHGKPTAKPIRKGELVTIDMGAVVDGYHSDLTRTVAVGKPAATARTVYGVVLTAQQRAIEHAKSGVTARALDAVARTHIKDQGFDKHFQHSLGHGIGLQIHEQPRISVQSTATLAQGQVITIEPGIYISGFGGVRIEDDVVVTEDGCEVLNKAPKNLLVL